MLTANKTAGQFLVTASLGGTGLVQFFILENVAAPVVTQQPKSQTVTAGVTLSFTAAASGTPAPSIQWMVKADFRRGLRPSAGRRATRWA